MESMKIYTKTGDDGNTGLQGNLRISKSHPRIISYGTVDEANAALGVVLSNSLDDDVVKILTEIQNDLFLVGADLSNPNLNDMKNRVSLDKIEKLEQYIDQFESELPPLTNFILPGGDITAAQLHHVRTIVRRAETLVVQLSEKDEINANCIKYLNRLSDLFFVMGRLINKRKNNPDIIWKS
jgi:cob(I)alamin adenosyltransferase